MISKDGILMLFLFLFVSACASMPNVMIKMDGAQLPNELQTMDLSCQDGSLRILWFFVRKHDKILKARGVEEAVPEIIPLGISMPSKLPKDTESAGIVVQVLNPKLLKYRLVKQFLEKEMKDQGVYTGIRDFNQMYVRSRFSAGTEPDYEFLLRLDLLGKDDFVIDSAYITTGGF